MRRRGDGRDGVRKKEGIPAVEISCVAVSQGAMKHVHQIGEMRIQRWDGLFYWVRWASELVIRLLFPLKKGMDMVYTILVFTKNNKHPRSAGFRSEDFVNPHAHK